MSKTFLFQAVQFSQTVLFQTIQFSISMQFDPLIGPLSGATTLGKSGPGSNGNEGVLHIPQSSRITGNSRYTLQPQPTGQKKRDVLGMTKSNLWWGFSSGALDVCVCGVYLPCYSFQFHSDWGWWYIFEFHLWI